MNALLCLAALASAPPTTLIRSADQLDYVLLADGRPVHVRLHLRNADKPYGAAMDDWTGRLFKWFDRDGDGFLSKAEAARLLPADWLTGFAQGGIRNDLPLAVPFATLDTDKDGKVSLAEFRAYVRRSFPGLSVFTQTFRADTAARVNDAIWKRLGAGAGRLSEAQVAKLPSLLGKLDENEDEMLSESELLQESADTYGFGFRPARMPGRATPFVVSLADTPPGQVAAMLLKKYAKGGKITRDEIGLGEAEFAALDLDCDGKLDARELERLVLRAPDVTFRGRVGSAAGAAGLFESLGIGLAPQRLALLTPAGAGLTKSLSRLSADSVRLSLGGTTISLTAMAGQGGGRDFPIARFYQQQFDMALPEKAKGLTREQADGNIYVAGLFTAADRNADALLEKKEFADFLALLGGASGASVTLQVDDGGRSLFTVIDADGNGQLSIREMRDAWKRIAPYCKDGKPLAREDLPRRVQVSLAAGPIFRVAPPAAIGGGPSAPARLTGPVPPWFAKMDRNGDGDISPSEWLGTEGDFKKLDLDGDGLISLEEARKAKSDPTKKGDATKK